MLGQPSPLPTAAGTYRVGPDETADALVGQYLRTCERARAAVAAGGLDDVVPTPWGAEVNLRAILVHMVQETARHNGHADPDLPSRPLNIATRPSWLGEAA